MNKYMSLASLNPDLILANRARLIEVFPELSSVPMPDQLNTCRACARKNAARAMILKLLDLPTEGRNLNKLKGILPREYFECLPK